MVWMFCLWLMLFCCLQQPAQLFASALTCTSVPSSEVNALYALYNATHGKSWTWKANKGNVWVFNTSTPNPCANYWQGIACAQDSVSATLCHIGSVVLDNYNLQGTLPTALGELIHTTTLQLSTNSKLVGSIPPHIANITYLSVLALNTNALTGSIPTSLTKLKHMTKLVLQYNKLHGSIPEHIGNMTALKQIGLNKNQLTGTIPTSVVQLPFLSVLYLHFNQLHGDIPTDIGNLTSLTKLQLNANSLSGTIPKSLSKLTSLLILVLSTNQLHGEIPDDIGEMYDLFYIDLSYNQLSGSIPNSIVTLPNMQYIVLHYNNLHSSIAHDIGNLTTLVALVLFSNHLTGSIPTSIVNCYNLFDLELQGNQLGGTIPNEIGFLFNLKAMHLDNNQLSGSIPEMIVYLQELTSLTLNQNQLQGSIPIDIGYMYSLQTLYLFENQLNGSIPESMVTLWELSDLKLSHNSFSGSIPNDFGNLTSLTDVELYTNKLTGTIPNSMGNLYLVEYLYLYENAFVGTLPESMVNMYSLKYLFVSLNHFTGTVPEFFADMPNLVELFLSHNLFHGSIPTSFHNLTYLEALALNGNGLTGSIPTTLEQCELLMLLQLSANQLTGVVPVFPNMEDISVFSNYMEGSLAFLSASSNYYYIELFDNFFTGSLPGNSIAAMSNLVMLQVQSNFLTGPIANLIDVDIQQYLFGVDLSHNAFTGPIPSSIFELQTLSYFAAAMNCLSGSIPTNVCDSKDNLEVLILDGLHATSSCQQPLFPGIPEIHTLAATHAITGSIPKCLFGEMQVLVVLHLSGNGLTGNLPDNYPALGGQLQRLSLSHNALTGTIPLSFQHHGWKELDLSFNLLQGDVAASINVTAYTIIDNADQNGASNGLILNNNRLSGSIPSAVMNLPTLDILSGNMFECDAAHDLPANDPVSATYMCGSDEANNSLIVFVVLLVTAGVFLVVLFKVKFTTVVERPGTTWEMCTAILQHTKDMLYLALDPHDPNYPPSAAIMYNFLNNTYHLHVYIVRICVIITAVYLLCYGGLGVTFSTYTHKYVWAVSIAYLSGLTPGVFLFLLLLITLVWLFLDVRCFERFLPRSVENKKLWRYIDKSSNILFVGKGMQSNSIAIPSPAAVATETSTTTPPVTALSWKTFIILAVFLLFILSAVIAVNAAFISATLSGVSIETQSILAFAMSIFKNISIAVVMQSLQWKFMHEVEHAWGQDSVTRILLALCLFNNILAPFIATAFVNTNCFYYALTPAADIEAKFTYGFCKVFLDDSGSCAEWINMVVTTTYQPSFTYSYQCTSSLLATFTPVWMYMLLTNAIPMPLIMCVVISVVEVVDRCQAAEGSSNQPWIDKVFDKLIPFRMRPLSRILKQLQATPKPEEIETLGAGVIESRNYTIMITINVAILLCFGILFPPLAIVAGLCTITQTMLQKMFVVRIMNFAHIEHVEELYDANTLSLFKQLILSMDAQCNKVPQTYFRTAKTIVIYVSIIWGAFLWDILGDEVGYMHSMWVLLLMFAVGCVIRCLGIYVSHRQKLLQHNVENALVKEGVEKGDEEAIELTTIVKNVSSSIKQVVEEERQEAVDNPLVASITQEEEVDHTSKATNTTEV